MIFQLFPGSDLKSPTRRNKGPKAVTARKARKRDCSLLPPSGDAGYGAPETGYPASSQGVLFSLPSLRQAWNSTEALVPFRFEQQLHPELLAVLVKPCPQLPFASVDFTSLELDSNSLIRLAGNDKVLEVRIGLLNLLLVCAHETDPGVRVWRDLRELELEKEAVLARVGIANLRNPVSWSADLDHVLLHLHTGQQPRHHAIIALALLLFLRRATRKIRLMFTSLRVGQIRAVVLVDCQAKTALEAADVILEEVRVLVEVDRLERELAETLTAVGVRGRRRRNTATAKFRACAVLLALVMGAYMWFGMVPT